ncbi:MAG: hypothetical protein JNM56_31830 [Planctomycetia bacterium]|nr:hypothetical protein [Planctomycetia bacterium]
MMLATLVALLGATASRAQEAETPKPAAPETAATLGAPAACDADCCADRDCGRARCRGPLARLLERRNGSSCCDDCCSSDCKNDKCDKSCGKRCSLSAIRDWLCFKRPTVRCPKGPAPRNPPLYTFFPCDDCGDGCGPRCADGQCGDACGTACASKPCNDCCDSCSGK